MSRRKPAAPTHGAKILLELGGRLREVREREGVSLGILAYQIGVSPTLILRWEQGTRWPKVADILELSRVFGLPAAYFLDGLDGPSEVEILLRMGIIAEEDVIRVRSYLYERRHGKAEPPLWPDWDRDGMGDAHRDDYER